MNKYIKMFMDDNNLKVGDEFRKKGTDAYDIWHFNEDGRIENKRGIGSNKVLIKFLLGEWEVEKVKKEPWKPKEGEQYFYVHNYGDVRSGRCDVAEWHDYLISHISIFKTLEEAKDYKWFLDKVDEYKKPFKLYKHNYRLLYNYHKETIGDTYAEECLTQGAICFGDKNNLNSFIKEVGEDRIKKYMFGVYE